MESGLNVQVVDGNRGEFSVSVDGREVASKTGDQFPTPDEVAAAVKSGW